MQQHHRVNFGGLCFACSVFSSRASRGQFSLSSVVPFIAHRGRHIHPFARLLFRLIHGSKNEAYHFDVLVLLRFVSFPGLKNEAYTCVLSLFRRAFAPFHSFTVPFHSFTVLVSTRGFKRASPSRIKGPGDLGFKERVMLRGYRACFDSWL